MWNHPLFDQLESSLRDVVRGDVVHFLGEWRTASRRTYKTEAQAGSGSGPFRDVIDLIWHGALTSVSPVSGIAFLVTAQDLYWVKVPEVSPTLPVQISFHSYADCEPQSATFTARIAGAFLPGVPVAGSAEMTGVCSLGFDVVTTGRVACLARASSAAIFVCLLQRDVIKMGRKHLWRLRDEVASSVPAEIRELLTRRRTGFVRSGSPGI